MLHVEQLLGSHPHPNGGSAGSVAECVIACLECASACTSCADACLADEDVARLVACIRLAQDSAAICRTTADILSRANHPDSAVVNGIVAACLTACEACMRECWKHALGHCRICAEACAACARACEAIIATMA